MIKNLIYIANARIPTEKAHGIAIMKLCEAFAQQGASVALLAANRQNTIQDDPFSYYDIAQKFPIERLPVLDAIRFRLLGPVGFWIETVSFTISLIMRLRCLRETAHPADTVLFSHEHLPLYAASFLYPVAFYDMHDFPTRGFAAWRAFFFRMRGIVATNEWKKRELEKRFRVLPDRVFVFPNGVDLRAFSPATSRREARDKLGLPHGKKIVLYAGHLYSWKGVDTVLTASRVFPADTLLYAVGGTDRDITKRKAQSAKRGLHNVIFVGRKPHREIPLWLRAADILVIPNTAKEEISRHFTSPMKLFEYMASCTPVVASRVPSIEEIADEKTVWFFEADNAASCGRAIMSACENEWEAAKRARRAHETVQKYAWDARACAITQFINQKLI